MLHFDANKDYYGKVSVPTLSQSVIDCWDSKMSIDAARRYVLTWPAVCDSMHSTKSIATRVNARVRSHQGCKDNCLNCTSIHCWVTAYYTSLSRFPCLVQLPTSRLRHVNACRITSGDLHVRKIIINNKQGRKASMQSTFGRRRVKTWSVCVFVCLCLCVYRFYAWNKRPCYAILCHKFETNHGLAVETLGVSTHRLASSLVRP